MEQEYSKEKALLEKFNNGQTNPHEELKINAAFNQFAEDSAEDNSGFNAEETGEKIWAKLPPAETHIKTVPLWPRVATIAAAVAAIAFGIYFLSPSRHPDDSRHPELVSGPQDIAPGHQGATLTLANGKEIKLTNEINGKLADQSGVTVSKTANGKLVYEIASATRNDGKSDQINTLSTANGETYQVRLPDGTMVWLNSASSLTYKANVSAYGRRVVELSGEAYFEVAKDKAHPFVVQTRIQEVEVLGTHFNIKSYADEPSVATTLLEGSVKIKAGTARQIIKPGEQGVSTGLDIKVKSADLEEVTAWKNGYFRFNDQKITDIMLQLSRWYDIEVKYEGMMTEEGLYGKISRYKNISDVLKMLEKTGLLHFKVEGRRVTVLR